MNTTETAKALSTLAAIADVPGETLERIVREAAGAVTLRQQAADVDSMPFTAGLSAEMRDSIAGQWLTAANDLVRSGELAEAELQRRRAASTARRGGITYGRL